MSVQDDLNAMFPDHGSPARASAHLWV